MKRILMLSIVLALLGAMVLSSVAFAHGGNGAGDGSGPILLCLDRNGDTFCGRP
jgi:phosphate/sulfate permease